MGTVVLHQTMRSKHQLLQPPLVVARSPVHADTKTKLQISPQAVMKLAQARRISQLFEMWAHLVGEMPPINNAGHIANSVPNGAFATLSDAAACFRGILRPCGEHDEGDDIVAYAFRTEYTLRWTSSLVCTCEAREAPPSSVFVAYARMGTLQCEQGLVGGVITKWEFVEADMEHPHLPKGYQERYRTTLWIR